MQNVKGIWLREVAEGIRQIKGLRAKAKSNERRRKGKGEGQMAKNKGPRESSK
jgi:hypothetical protein